MARATRPMRRSGRRTSLSRRLVVVVVISVIFVTFVSAISTSASHSNAYRSMINRSFGVQASSILLSSNIDGASLASITAGAPSQSRLALQTQLDQLARDVTSNASSASFIGSPPPSGDAGPAFARGLARRRDAVGAVVQAIDGLLVLAARPVPGSAEPVPAPPTPISSTQASALLAQAALDLDAGQGSLRHARHDLANGPGHYNLATTPWPDSVISTAAGREAFVNALISSPTLAPAPRLFLVLVTLEPQPVPLSLVPDFVTLPPTTELVVRCVVRNTGNVDIPLARVTATLTGVTSASVATRTQRASIAMATSVGLVFPNFSVTPGTRYRLTVSVSPPPGQLTTANLVDQTNLVIAPATK